MNTPKREKENVKRKIQQGIFNTRSKPASAIAQWRNTFVRVKDDKENIIAFVQCIKCLLIFAYESSKTDSSTHKAHAESCPGGSPSSRRNQDINCYDEQR